MGESTSDLGNGVHVHESVQKYYGQSLTSSADLQTNACCTDIAIPPYIKKILAQLHDEVLSKYYGCGLTIPLRLEGLKVLDLGSGSGRDCFLLSKLVGESGQVVGVDMTPEQLAISRRHIDFHTDKFCYSRSNVRFLQGHIETLDQLELEDQSFDLIVSNCVINLAKDKQKVLKHAYRLLKNGGEMYFSDVYADRRLPAQVVADPVLYGECLGGALYWNDFLRYSRCAGFADPRQVEKAPITVKNPTLEAKLGSARFSSISYRLFKLPQLEDACEDFGQAVSYRGSIPESPDFFHLDNGHIFERGRIYPVCGNTYAMLEQTRFKKDFNFFGDSKTHYGLFADCGVSMANTNTNTNTNTNANVEAPATSPSNAPISNNVPTSNVPTTQGSSCC